MERSQKRRIFYFFPNIWPSQICRWKGSQMCRHSSGLVWHPEGERPPSLEHNSPYRLLCHPHLCNSHIIWFYIHESPTECWSSAPSSVPQQEKHIYLEHPCSTIVFETHWPLASPFCLPVLGPAHSFHRNILVAVACDAIIILPPKL